MATNGYKYTNGYDHEETEESETNGHNGMNGHNGINGHNGTNGHNGSNGWHSIAEEEEESEDDQESFNTLYRLVQEESPPPPPPPVRKASVATQSAKERARRASRELKREQNDTSGGGRRSLKREHLIIKWILRVTHADKDSSIDFADWIKDGQILSRIMTTLCFNSIERDQWSSFGCSPEEQRVKDVRAQILDYGVDSKYLFRVEDVTKKMNTPKVVRCLEEVAKLAAQETHIKYDTLLSNKLYT